MHVAGIMDVLQTILKIHTWLKIGLDSFHVLYFNNMKLIANFLSSTYSIILLIWQIKRLDSSSIFQYLPQQ